MTRYQQGFDDGYAKRPSRAASVPVPKRWQYVNGFNHGASERKHQDEKMSNPNDNLLVLMIDSGSFRLHFDEQSDADDLPTLAAQLRQESVKALQHVDFLPLAESIVEARPQVIIVNLRDDYNPEPPADYSADC